MSTFEAYTQDLYTVVRVRADCTTVPSRPLQLAFLLDVSDSMSGERLDAVKRTLQAARALFLGEDRVTVITFGDEATTVVHDHSMANLEEFYRHIYRIRTHGCTNLSCGLESLHARGGAWDAVILLTDGHINSGITSVAGLIEMAAGVGNMPFYTLGYGADHNRELLRDLALQSRGSYTFVDSDEVLPVAMGEMIGGLRTEVLHNARISLGSGSGSGICECYEVGGTENTYRVGGVVANRDYWCVFVNASGDVTVTLDADDMVPTTVTPTPSESVEVYEQILRCRVARAMRAASIQQLTELLTEITELDDAVKAQPLVLRMRGQIAEILEELRNTHGRYNANTLTRLASNAVYYSNQRGTQSAGDPDAFCSPVQRNYSESTRNHFSSR
jgi:hypothetical protein